MPQHPGKNRGGRIPPDGRPAQAKGVGKNAKRHDLERPKTPGLHGSDLQQGDVQAMEQGQRIAPAQTQQRGQAPAQVARQTREIHPDGDETSSMQIPDAIDFLGSQQGNEFNIPTAQRAIDNSAALTWLPIIRELAVGPGSSGQLASLLIQQARKMRQSGGQAATTIDMNAADEGIEAMLDVGLSASSTNSPSPNPRPPDRLHPNDANSPQPQVQ